MAKRAWMGGSGARRLPVLAGLVAAVCSCAAASQAPGQDLAAEVGLFDTATSAAAPLTTDAISGRTGWVRLPADATNHAFRGDAVLTNGPLAVVLRRRASGAEVDASLPGGFAQRTVLSPTSNDSAGRLTGLRVAENAPSAVAVDATFEAADGGTFAVRFGLEIGQPFVQTEALSRASGLRVEAPCRFAVLPDFFADDVVIDARTMPAGQVEIPSEHFLLHLLPDRQTIVMAVWKSNEADVRAVVGAGEQGPQIERSEIAFGRDGTVWVALLGGSEVWFVHDVAPDDAGKVAHLAWRPPFAAQWRVDWTRSGGLVDSWEMVAERRDGRYDKPGWFGEPNVIQSDRRRWTTVLGWFHYPCWIDRDGRAYLQPLAKRVRFEGPAVIYPINRTRQTPLDAFTVVDVMRATLGVGPCEYILDVEGQPAAMRGRATCAVRDALNAIYEAKRQKHEKAAIEAALADGVAFVRHIRDRIEGYVEFGHEMLAYLDEQKKARPELADFLAEMEGLTRTIDERFAARREPIKTPEYVAALADEFRATLIDYEGDDALEKCKRITREFTQVGGNQDELVGECRMAVKILRQRAGLAMSADPRTAEIAQEIRRRTQAALRNPSTYEAPRH